MKTKRTMFIAILFAGMTVAFSVSCKKTIEDATTVCNTLTNLCAGKSVKYCVNPIGNGYYEYNGVQYSFTATTISTAATNVVHAMGCK
jgi:hypothetical protein